MMILIAAWAAAALLGSPSPAPQDAGKKETPVEMSQPLKDGGGLGTAGYEPTAKEAPFLKKVTEKPVAFWSDVKMPKPSNMTDEEWAKFLKEEQKAKAKAN